MRRSWRQRAGERQGPDGEPIWFWHSQNLNERQHGPDGPMWRHGRAWLHYNDGRHGDHRDRCVGWEWVLWDPKRWGFKIGVEMNTCFGADYDLAGQVCLPCLGAFYWHFEGVFPDALKDRLPQGKRLSFEIYEEYVWINLWASDPAEHWGRDQNRFRWQRVSWDWKRTLMGRMEHKLEWLSRDVGHWWQVDAESNWHDIQIPMPEGSYPARYRIERRTWWRRRWPGKLVKIAADIEIPRGVAIPGKGENSWDIDDDAYMGMSCAATDEAGIIAHVVKQTLAARERYGGSVRWQPREKRV